MEAGELISFEWGKRMSCLSFLEFGEKNCFRHSRAFGKRVLPGKLGSRLFGNDEKESGKQFSIRH